MSTTSSPSNSGAVRVFNNLIWPLEKRFVWKMAEDQANAAKDDMVAAFASYSAEELQSAAAYIRQHRKFSTMPTVGDIHAVLAEIREAQKPKAATASPGGALTLEQFKQRMADETKAAKDWARDWLRRSDLGRESIRDGWCRDLYSLAWQVRLGRIRRNDLRDDLTVDDLATKDTEGQRVLEAFRQRGRSNAALLEVQLLFDHEAAPAILREAQRHRHEDVEGAIWP